MAASLFHFDYGNSVKLRQTLRIFFSPAVADDVHLREKNMANWFDSLIETNRSAKKMGNILINAIW